MDRRYGRLQDEEPDERVLVTTPAGAWDGMHQIGKMSMDGLPGVFVLVSEKHDDAVRLVEQAGLRPRFATTIRAAGAPPWVLVTTERRPFTPTAAGCRILTLEGAEMARQGRRLWLEMKRAVLEHLWTRYQVQKPGRPEWPVVPPGTAPPLALTEELWTAYQAVRKGMDSRRPFRHVLIEGLTGSGKEPVAKFLCRAWHEGTGRDAEPGPVPRSSTFEANIDKTLADLRNRIAKLEAEHKTAYEAATLAELAVHSKALGKIEAENDLASVQTTLEPGKGKGGKVTQAGNRVAAAEKELKEAVDSARQKEEILGRCERALRDVRQLYDAAQTGGALESAAAYLAAREDRRRSTRHAEVSLTGFPTELATGHIVGWRPGAFSNAETTHHGPFEQAGRGGSVHLDEVAKASPAAQAALLRISTNGRVRPLGAPADIDIAPQLLVVTSSTADAPQPRRSAEDDGARRLREGPGPKTQAKHGPIVRELTVAHGAILSDLRSRLEEIHIRMPALAEYNDDTFEQIVVFLASSAADGERVHVTSLAMDAFRRHRQAGRIQLRGLSHLVDRAVRRALERRPGAARLVVVEADVPD